MGRINSVKPVPIDMSDGKTNQVPLTDLHLNHLVFDNSYNFPKARAPYQECSRQMTKSQTPTLNHYSGRNHSDFTCPTGGGGCHYNVRRIPMASSKSITNLHLSSKSRPEFEISARNCLQCSKPVYANEQVLTSFGVSHKMCFKCFSCNKMLDKASACDHRAQYYCPSN
ncbi:hypothetical protein Ciccas_004739 [Cichlidogyrus casuarinus]|uniref:LIM zinc-binding domain-containing protein n=1 Tax=Cichlidogyrus casuarinus TaxID=1844966 RepID=A0ABD2QAP8_9PLAT